MGRGGAGDRLRTIEARIRVWLGLDQTVLVRIRDIDACEMKGDCPEEAVASKDALSSLLAGGPITLTNIKHDKYDGRVDAAPRLPEPLRRPALDLLKAMGRE